MTTPWAPPHHAAGAPAPLSPPNIPPTGAPLPPPYAPAYAATPPHRPGPRLATVIAAFSAVVLAAIAITAVVTAAIVRPAASTQTTPMPAAPQYTSEDQRAAKDQLCRVFDAGERGNAGRGGVVVGGQLNIPVVLRMINTIVGVQSAMSPATPADLSKAAKKFVAAENELTTAALASAPVETLTALTRSSNATIDELADACGLPR